MTDTQSILIALAMLAISLVVNDWSLIDRICLDEHIYCEYKNVSLQD